MAEGSSVWCTGLSTDPPPSPTVCAVSFFPCCVLAQELNELDLAGVPKYVHPGSAPAAVGGGAYYGSAAATPPVQIVMVGGGDGLPVARPIAAAHGYRI